MKISNGKDFWAGLMFLGTGLGFMLVSRNYPMGTAVRMGPAYFPTMLGGLLAVLGAIVFFRAFVSKMPSSMQVFPFRPWVFAAGVALSVVAYMSMGLRDAGTVAYAAHMVLSGVALTALFAAFGQKSLWVILATVMVYGYLLKPLGLVLDTVVLIVFSALAGHEFKWKEVALLSIGLAIFSVAAFVYGLQLPMNIWPSFLE